MASATGSALGLQYNFYVNDRNWGRMFVGVCPYFPFSARLCLNQHHWLARLLRQEKIDFQQTTNAFLRRSALKRLQELADSLTAHDLLVCGRKWFNGFTPFSPKENGAKPIASIAYSLLR